MDPSFANGINENRTVAVVGSKIEIEGLALEEDQYVEEDLDGKEEEEEEGEFSALLSTQSQKAMVVNTNDKPDVSTKRKVQWNDKNGNKLVEVWEFQPSDSSDSDDDDDSDTCICVIM